MDTGSNSTFFYPSVRGALDKAEISQLRTKKEKVGGAGGVIERKTELLPAIRLDMDGKAITLKDLSLLTETPADSRRYRDGVIGMDALWNGFLLDFEAMRVEIQPTSPH